MPKVFGEVGGSAIGTHPEAVRRALIAHLGLAARDRQSFAQAVAALGAVQMDPMRVVAPAHLLTLRLRRGPTSEAAFSRALGSGEIFEARLKERCIVSAQDLPAAAAQFARARARELLDARGLRAIAEEILAELAKGPRYSRELGTEDRVSSFWDGNPQSMKATTMALDILAYEGRVIVTGRRRGERRYDLPGRHFPDWEQTILAPESARRTAARHYGRTMGVFLASDPYLGWQMESAAQRRALAQEMCEAGEWQALRIDGVERSYLCTRELAQRMEDSPARARGAAILAPLENLLWDRRRLWDLFGFRYTWEAYTPAARRTVGPYGMPVLLDGRLVAELDAGREEDALRYRIVPRTALRERELQRIARAGERLARELGLTGGARQVESPGR